MKIFFFFLLASLCFSASAFAAGKDAFPFLLINPSPRAESLGGAFSPVAEGPETVFYNPGGLASENHTHFYTQSFVPPVLEDVKYTNFIYARPQGNGAWSVQSGILHTGGFTRTVADPSSAEGFRETGGFSTYDLKLAFSIGRKLSKTFGWGTSASFIRESLADAQVNAGGFDFGFTYDDPMYPLRLGAAVQNLGFKVKFKEESYGLPLAVRAGLAFRNTQKTRVPFLPLRSIVTSEFFRPLSGENLFRGGLEVPIGQHLLVRTGYQHSLKKQELGSKLYLPSGLAAGFGLDLRTWGFDYSLSSLGELGLVHRFSIDFRWEKQPGFPSNIQYRRS